jgi:hypothetical protein
MKLIDLTGMRFGRLVVINFSKRDGKSSYWNCICDCGNEHIVRSDVLRKGISKSCGCLQIELLRKRITTHGLKKKNKRLYEIWQGMKRRCAYKKTINYDRYGGRGITVCNEWKNDFHAFYSWALSHGYKENLTIDRIDNNGNYCPENCHWTTMFYQNRNKSNNHILTFNGVTKVLSDWALETGVSRRTLTRRLAGKLELEFKAGQIASAYQPEELALAALEA